MLDWSEPEPGQDRRWELTWGAGGTGHPIRRANRGSIVILRYLFGFAICPTRSVGGHSDDFGAGSAVIRRNSPSSPLPPFLPPTKTATRRGVAVRTITNR